jgi:two-component system catabolic regulation response regulator CreB
MPQHILVVEDEPSIADTIVYALGSEGFQVTSCLTGGAALEKLQESAFDLIVLDVGLPDGNGFELLKQIRKQWNLPVIFLTARSDEVDRVVGLEIGADDYVVKPFSPRELSARVRSILRRSAGHVPETVVRQYGRFSLDSQKLLICFDGVALELSRYEFKIFAILLGSPGRVYSREQLMQLAWDEPEMSLERTVDAHIKSLRAKLRAVDAEADPIVTHRGFGYSLRESL